jgi:hypothetical protein
MTEQPLELTPQTVVLTKPVQDVSLKRAAWAYGCAKKGSDEERMLLLLLLEKVQPAPLPLPPDVIIERRGVGEERHVFFSVEGNDFEFRADEMLAIGLEALRVAKPTIDDEGGAA